MTEDLKSQFSITTADNEIPSIEVLTNEAHHLTVEVNANNNYACLYFSSRIAMYDFARSLLQESLYGTGNEKEFYPLKYQERLEVINGVRMTLNSARVFIFYPDMTS